MNELSIKEKAQRYDKAIDVINKCETDKYGCIIGVKPTDIFPELQGSEDEKIRKEVISFVEQAIDAGYGIISKERKEEWIAWLEKKGEQKHTDNVEPKFKVEPKSAWSKEDDIILDGIIEEIKANKNSAPGYDIPVYDRFLSFLKALKERYTWKPSKKQIMALRWVLNHIPYDSHKEEISGLLEQINKLMEE